MLAVCTVIYFLGWFCSFPLLSRLGPIVVMAAAPMIGWLFLGLAALVSLWVGLGIQPVGYILGLLGFSVVAWLIRRPRFYWQEQMAPMIVGFLLAAAVGELSEFVDFHIFVPDAITFTLLGRWAGGHQPISAAVASAFLDFGSLPIAWQSLARLLFIDYLHGLGPSLAASLLVAFSVLGGRLWESMTPNVRARRQAALLACAWLLTTPLFLVHAQTVHSILPGSLFGFWFMASMLLYFQERRGEWLVASFLGLVGFTLCRVEGPIYSAFFLAICFSDDRLPTRYFARFFHPYAALIFAYYVFLAYRFIPHFDAILDPEKIAFVLAPLAILFVGTVLFPALLAISPRVATLVRRHLANFTLIACAGALAFFTFWFHANLGKSLFWTGFNLTQTGQWGFSAIGFIIALLLLMKSPRAPWEKTAWQFLGAAILCIFTISAARLPFRPSPWDTGNRLVWLFFPIALLIVLGRWCGSSSNKTA